MGGLLLGVDGGNTKTIAVVARPDGTVVGVGSGGCGDIHNAASPEVALDEIHRACAQALRSAGVDASELGAAAFSLAGADWPEDFAVLENELTRRMQLATAPIVVNDAIGAIRCGTGDGVGVAVVCGTHGTAGARNAAGDVYHFGFWPDDTGATGLAAHALAAVWRAELGIGPETSLTARALARWDAADPVELLHAFTRLADPVPASEHALFADAVLDEAEEGDAVAVEIVRLVGTWLGDYARVTAARTGQLGSPFPLVLCGGVLRHSSSLLREAILDRVPEADPVYPAIEPVGGAVLLAGDAIGARSDLGKLREALPFEPVRLEERTETR
jgi:N-acetylglucosamine kinase-like BadF-type ATPase